MDLGDPSSQPLSEVACPATLSPGLRAITVPLVPPARDGVGFHSAPEESVGWAPSDSS